MRLAQRLEWLSVIASIEMANSRNCFSAGESRSEGINARAHSIIPSTFPFSLRIAVRLTVTQAQLPSLRIRSVVSLRRIFPRRKSSGAASSIGTS